MEYLKYLFGCNNSIKEPQYKLKTLENQLNEFFIPDLWKIIKTYVTFNPINKTQLADRLDNKSKIDQFLEPKCIDDKGKNFISITITGFQDNSTIVSIRCGTHMNDERISNAFKSQPLDYAIGNSLIWFSEMFSNVMKKTYLLKNNYEPYHKCILNPENFSYLFLKLRDLCVEEIVFKEQDGYIIVYTRKIGSQKCIKACSGTTFDDALVEFYNYIALKNCTLQY